MLLLDSKADRWPAASGNPSTLWMIDRGKRVSRSKGQITTQSTVGRKDETSQNTTQEILDDNSS
jgi:hypothetical protein